MNIGIIEAGQPPLPLLPAYGAYDGMVRRLLGSSHAYSTFRAFEGRLPESPDRMDGLVITGSAAGVADGFSWIDQLIKFLKVARGRTKMVGICFGHQVMAQAFGGNVERNPLGWRMGVQTYSIRQRTAWMDKVDEIRAIVSHRDQVVLQPPASRVLAESAFSPFAGLAYDNHPSISFQFHPEFSAKFARELFRLRRDLNLSDEQREQATASLRIKNDGVRVGAWINDFLAEEGSDVPGPTAVP